MRLLPATEDLDDAHQPATTGAWLAQCERNDRVGRLRCGLGLSLAEQAADAVLSLPMFPELTAAKCETVASAVKKLVAREHVAGLV